MPRFFVNCCRLKKIADQLGIPIARNLDEANRFDFILSCHGKIALKPVGIQRKKKGKGKKRKKSKRGKRRKKKRKGKKGQIEEKR